MILFEEALNIVRQSATTLGIESAAFLDAVGCVLAEDIISDIDMPPFDKSAMDGYACRRQDMKNELTIIEMVQAGEFPTKAVGENECIKIMTGAPVPKGADTVIMVEYTRTLPGNKIRYLKEESKSNICKMAEDVRAGETLLKKGTLLQPRHIPVLASVGATVIRVYKRPKIAIISTGNELVEPPETPGPSQIRNSNAYQLLAQIRQLGLEAEYIGLAKDTRQDTLLLLDKTRSTADIVILTGAVSMGDYDFVPEVLKEKGVKILFHGIHAKPGKRTLFGQGENQWFVGLPGNPVSSFVQFEMLVKPLIYKIMGTDYHPVVLKLPLSEDYYRKNAIRKAFQPVRLTEEGTVKQIEYHGSAHIHALSYADGLMIVEKDITSLKKGELVDVRPI
jgi:molybdopterin molybdotransferase